MENVIAFLGRQQAISLAELESLHGAESIRKKLPEAAIIQIEAANFNGDSLGGTTKAAKILATVPTQDTNAINSFVLQALPEHVADTPEGRITFGVSSYGLRYNQKDLTKLGIRMKAALKKAGRSARHVPSKQQTLSDAQVLHNKLVGPKGMELCLVADGDQTHIAQTFFVQNLDAYTKRDRNRPARDAKVGMLPPKLAQILINLSVGSFGDKNTVVLDPFCGTGVLLQEATLMGYGVYGTDLEPRMIEYTQTNLDWITRSKSSWELEVGDARTHQWRGFTHAAAETYLGTPFFKLPPKDILDQTVFEVNQLHKEFFMNIASQTKSGTRMCFGVPAWALKNGTFRHLPALDSLEEIGYNRLDFVNAPKETLIYHRPGQVVARELIILQRT